MTKVTDNFGVTTEEFEAVKGEAERLEAMGYKVPNIEIKFIVSGAQGIAGLNTIYIHPNTDIKQIKFVTRHEIGHHNEPETELDIWADDYTGGDYLTNDKVHQASEDFANDFARKTA